MIVVDVEQSVGVISMELTFLITNSCKLMHLKFSN